MELHGKLYKALCMIDALKKYRYSIKRLADNFQISERTVYRYLDMFERVGFMIEQDFEGRYFIIAESTKLENTDVSQMQELQSCNRDQS